MTNIEDRVRDAVRDTPSPEAGPTWGDVVTRGRQITRRRRTGQGLLVLAVAGVVTIGLIVADHSSQQSSRSIVASPGQDESPTSTLPSVKLSPQQVESTLLPITPTDYTNGTRLLMEFQPRARLAAQSRCLTRRGYADAGAETLALFRPTHGQLQYFEDPDGLRRDGFGVVKDSQPAPSSDGTPPAAKTLAVPADVTRSCEQVAEDVVAPLAQPVSAFYEWTKEVENIDTSDAMKPAWQAWSACMADKGYNVATESQFFGMANQAIENSLQKELVLATAYADCLESNVIPVRTDLRTAAKTTYASANAAQVEAAERDLPAAIDKISRETGVSYPG